MLFGCCQCKRQSMAPVGVSHSISIALKPEVETRLRQKAAQNTITVEEYVQGWRGSPRQAPPPPPPLSPGGVGSGWSSVGGHPQSLPCKPRTMIGRVSTTRAMLMTTLRSNILARTSPAKPRDARIAEERRRRVSTSMERRPSASRRRTYKRIWVIATRHVKRETGFSLQNRPGAKRSSPALKFFSDPDDTRTSCPWGNTGHAVQVIGKNAHDPASVGG